MKVGLVVYIGPPGFTVKYTFYQTRYFWQAMQLARPLRTFSQSSQGDHLLRGVFVGLCQQQSLWKTYADIIM
jgi:hypothetical protein